MTTRADLHPLANNPRTHSPENIALITDALRQVGAARSGVIDEAGNLLAGNGTYQALGAAGIEKVRVIEAQGDEWIVVQRTGLTEKQKRLLTYFDNRASDLAGWLAEEIIADVAGGLKLAEAGVFTPAEIEQYIHAAERESREGYAFLDPPGPNLNIPNSVTGDVEPGPPDPATGAPATRGQAATSPRFALAIVLNRAEAAQWTAYKGTVGKADDKAAFLLLLAAVEGSDG
jgi:hypothetical protein